MTTISLFDKIIIVGKDSRRWDRKLCKYVEDDIPQGYIVDPSNKKSLESALHWAKWTEYIGEFHRDTRKYDEEILHEGIIYEFDNSDFRMELFDSAHGSSEGGKLSFWNCKIIKDDKEFIIGISSDLLLDVLRYNDFIQGVCQSTLMFGRCKGGVGLLSTNMPTYQQALADVERKKNMNKGKTSKVVEGRVYETTTLSNVYLGKMYSWYEPIYSKESNYYYYSNVLVGFKRREKPVPLYFYPCWYEDKTKMSDYKDSLWGISRIKPPSRKESTDKFVEIDMTMQEMVDIVNDKNISAWHNPNYTNRVFWDNDLIGISASDTEFEFPNVLKEILTSAKLKIE
ncbi:MAG: hypothetical protein IKL53_10295 [Lachnospiraceae bacterium]|nr:hypothetical protein [Lachnospiraceae bacterium]